MIDGRRTDSSLQNDGSPPGIRVVILAETRFYREGLAQVLGREPSLRIVAAGTPRDETLAGLSDFKADVILIDMAMSGGLATVRAIVEAAADARVVALGVTDAENDVLSCAEAGLAGYVPREASLTDLVRVVESVSRGEAICSPRIAASLLRRIATLAAGQPRGAAEDYLTSRENEVIQLVDRGLSNKDIARRLGIELTTVKNHVHNILEKLHVHRRGEAAARMRTTTRRPAAISGSAGAEISESTRNRAPRTA